MVKLAIHCGAVPHSVSQDDDRQQEINDLSSKYYENLKSGASAIDVVESVVNEMENNRSMNAGLGSYLQSDGLPRPESGLMTDTRDFGAVMGIERIKNPSSVARSIMEESNNNMLCGRRAVEYALQQGFKTYNISTDSKIDTWNDSVNKKLIDMGFKDRIRKIKEMDKGTGTVGCVALDDSGDMCACTSTGGRKYQVAGRVGDAPIVGCGFYCDDQVAVSCSGVGEAIMMSSLSRRVAENYNNNLDVAVDKSLRFLKDNTNGEAGIIAISVDGDGYTECNTEGMYSVVK